MLMISSVSVKNFRVLKDVTIPLDKQTVIVGENNSGKTAFFELLELILSPTSRGLQILERDLHHDADSKTEPIEVNIELRPVNADVFTEETKQLFYPHVDVEPDGKERLIINVQARYDPEEDAFRSSARFMKSDGKFDEGGFLPFRKNVSFFMVNSVRDVRRELYTRQGLWSRLARTRGVEVEKMEDIRKLGQEVGEKLLSMMLGAEEFSEMVADFTKFLKTVLWSDQQPGTFQFSLVPAEFEDFVRNIELKLQNPGETKPLPVLSHGVGLQSLTVFALVMAHMKALGYNSPIVAVEEPEAHLHPQAQRALVREVMRSSTQSLISTHSTFVTDLVKPTQVVLLKRRGNRSEARFVPEGYLEDSEERALSRYIRGTTSEFYFAKCVLLVEGDGDRAALPVFGQAKGVDFDRMGISVIQVHGGNFKPFMKLFAPAALGIPWVVLCDNDRAIVDCLKHAVDLGIIPPPRDVTDAESRRADLESRNVFFYPVKGDFEWYLLESGFVSEYEQAIEEVHGTGVLDSWVTQTIRNQPDLAQALRAQQINRFIESKQGGRKPELAAAMTALITEKGTNPGRIPDYFVRVIDRVVSLAEQEILRTGSGNPTSQS
ncbi:MAG: AAA family ATPase [Candidatus Omnitrophica bacterium]|nr:AAA family ATPase [Candidatus Omnitrophota bacterium]